MKNGNKPVNVALVGYGYWGPNLLRNLVSLGQDARVVACCDSSEERLQEIASRYPAVTVVKDFSELLAMPGVEAIVIATPVHTHYAFARKALDAGKHVFVEKPM